MYEADENGVVPERIMGSKIRTQEPVDVLRAVAAQGDVNLAGCINRFSSPPRSIAAQRDVKDPNIFYITMLAPEFEGPQVEVVLDAGKGYLMTKKTFRLTQELVEEVRVELGQVGRDRLWFPTSYEQTFYRRETPKSVSRYRTSRLSNIILNEALPSDAFNISRLNFPDGLKVNVEPVAGKHRLLVWFKGALLDEDAYMALMIAAHKNNAAAAATRPRAARVAQPPAVVHDVTGGRRWAAIALIGASLVGLGIAVVASALRRRREADHMRN